MTLRSSGKQVHGHRRRPARRPKPAAGVLDTAFMRTGERSFAGHVVDPADLTRRHVVEFLLDGLPLTLRHAQEHNEALVRAGIGDGCYGFTFTLAADAVAQGMIVEARLANLGTPIGAPIRLHDSAPRPEERAQRGSKGDRHARGPGREWRGHVRWAGGLRFLGWLPPAQTLPREGESGQPPKVTAIIDGEAVAAATAAAWQHFGASFEDAEARPPSTSICRSVLPMVAYGG